MGAAIAIRLDRETEARLDALVESVQASGMGRSTIARLCMLEGLAIAEKDPARVLLGATKRSRR